MLAPQKKSYDQSRQHIKKQRHYFANKGPSSQGYGFSSGHVWMWGLNHKEGWRPKNGSVLQRLNGFLQKCARLCFKLSSKRGMDTQSHSNHHWTIWQLLSFFQTSDNFSRVAWFRKLPFALQILGKEGVVSVLSQEFFSSKFHLPQARKNNTHTHLNVQH